MEHIWKYHHMDHFGGIDVVLFQADGHIEMRYYQFPLLSSAITIGISGSSTDYITLFNNVVPSFAQIESLDGAVVSFYPKQYTPPVTQAFCGIGNYNFTSLAYGPDLSIPVPGYTIYMRLCGTLSQSDCVANQGANIEICQWASSSTQYAVTYHYNNTNEFYYREWCGW